MNGWELVFSLAVGVEIFTELLKQFIQSLPTKLSDKLTGTVIQTVTAVIGVLSAFGTGLDLFKLTGIPFGVPYVGTIAIGLIIGRGSNYAHSIFNMIQTFKNPVAAVQSVEALGETLKPMTLSTESPIVSMPINVHPDTPATPGNTDYSVKSVG